MTNLLKHFAGEHKDGIDMMAVIEGAPVTKTRAKIGYRSTDVTISLDQVAASYDGRDICLSLTHGSDHRKYSSHIFIPAAIMAAAVAECMIRVTNAAKLTP
jgi:hypothetical protein